MILATFHKTKLIYWFENLSKADQSKIKVVYIYILY